MPDISLSTDIIVGHPGESAEEFDATVDLVKEILFDKIHIAAFSSRPGTRAATLEEDPAQAVPEGIKAQRRIELERVQEEIATQRSARLLHTVVEVLVEAESKGKWRGRSSGNQLVFFASPEDWRGRIARVHVTHTSPWSMSGDVIGEVNAE
jgi:tRNA-2-methylthio-N6-dimethylallyladenosine synthase